jgi:hypothetical protein
MEVNSNFDLSSDHTPVIATISKRVINVIKVPSLHNKRTDWQTYTKLIEVKLNLKISLKTSEEPERNRQLYTDTTISRQTSYTSSNHPKGN